MAHPRLRVIFGPEDASAPAGPPASTHVQNQVTVKLGDVLPLLVDAIEMQRTWLRDFEDDQITLSSDLFEVLLAYQSVRSAA